MISYDEKNTSIGTTNEIEEFLKAQDISYDIICDKELNQEGKREKIEKSAERTISSAISEAIKHKHNFLTITHYGMDFVTEIFHSLSYSKPFIGKTIFLLPDTTTCLSTKEKFLEMVSSRNDLKITALETLPQKETNLDYGDMLVSSGPVLQSCIMNPEKAPGLSSWLSSVELLVLSDIHYQSLQKRSLIFSILEILSPKQIFISTGLDNSFDDLFQFLTNITGKETTVAKLDPEMVPKDYFIIKKDFTFSKRIKLLNELVDQKHLCVLFTQSRGESQKLHYELTKNGLDDTKIQSESDGPTRKDSQITNQKVINLDACTQKIIQEKINPSIKLKSTILITSDPKEVLETRLNTITYLFMGLPKRSSEFSRFEKSFRIFSLKAKKNIIVIGGNEYDRLFVTNTYLFKNYIMSGSNSQSYVPDTTIHTLFMAIVHIKRHLSLTEEQRQLLPDLELTRKGESTTDWQLTKLGKEFVINYLLFKKKKYTVFFLHKEGKEPKNKMIDKEDLDALYYPGTIHYEDHRLQRVKSFTQDQRENKKPVFESLDENIKVKKLYKMQNYRTFVEPEILYDQDRILSNGLTLLNSKPKHLYTSYIDKTEHPFTLVSKKEEIPDAATTIQFGQILKVQFYEQPINMAMVVHAFIHALRILCDIDYKNWNYSINKTVTQQEKKVNELLIIDRTISDLLLIVHIEQTIAVAKELLKNYFQLIKVKAEEEPNKEYNALVIPLPHKRYHPAKREKFSFTSIMDCFNHLEQTLYNFQNPTGPIQSIEKNAIKNVTRKEVESEIIKPSNVKEPIANSRIKGSIDTKITDSENKVIKTSKSNESYLEEIKTSDWNSLRERFRKSPDK